MTTPPRKLRHTAVASLTVYRDKRGGDESKTVKARNFPKCIMILSSFLQCRVYFFHHFEFYFRYRQLIVFPAWGHSFSGCQGEMSSTFFFPGSYTIHPLMLYVSILEVFHPESTIKLFSCRDWPLIKNVGHDMAIVGEPCNVDAHDKMSGLFQAVFRQMSSSVKGHLLSRIVFRQRSSFVKVRLLSRIFHFILFNLI